MNKKLKRGKFELDSEVVDILEKNGFKLEDENDHLNSYLFQGFFHFFFCLKSGQMCILEKEKKEMFNKMM